MYQTKQNFIVQKWVTALSVVLFVLKITAYYLTDSLAILSDALESIVNIVAGFIGLYSLYVASKPRDEDHPYGHGKAAFISAAAEGSLIIAAGILIIFETIRCSNWTKVCGWWAQQRYSIILLEPFVSELVKRINHWL
jgi:cation diffusion facilitator family transporter